MNDYITLDYFKVITKPYLLNDETHPDFSAYPSEGMEILTKLKSIRILPSSVDQLKALSEISNELDPYRDAHLQDCFSICSKTHSAMLLILGTNEIRESAELLNNFGKLTYEFPQSQGHILCSPKWSLLLNDVMMIGAYMTGVPLHISSTTTYPKMADLDTGTQERILTRELRIAKCLGYIKASPASFEETIGISLQLPAALNLTYDTHLDPTQKAAAFERTLSIVRSATEARLSPKETRDLLGRTGSRPSSPTASSRHHSFFP